MRLLLLVAAAARAIPLPARGDGTRLLLLAAAAKAIPLPEKEADAFVSATFEGVAVAVPRFADLGASQSYAAFLASLGIGGVSAFRGEYRRAVQNCALQPIAQELEAVAAKTDLLHAAVAVRVSDRSLLVEWRGAESAEEASERLVEEASLILDINASRASLAEGVAAQLRVRSNQRSLQSEAFGVLRTLPGSDRSVSLMTFEAPVTSLFHGVHQTAIENGELPTFVLNLASSFGRRQHVRSQLQRASLLDQARWISAVDGSLLSPRVTRATLREGSVLSQGEVGIWLSHLTAWHDIVEEGLPFALVVEDDVVLSADIKAVLRNVLIALDGEEWDIVALDVGVPGHEHIGVETTRPFISQRCVDAARQLYENGEVVSKLHGGCAHASIGGALISWAGAQKLTQSALPVERPVDTYVERLVRDGALNAWASLPAVAHVDGRNTSDSVRRYLRVEGPHVHYTFRADDASLPTCFDTPCQITVAVE